MMSSSGSSIVVEPPAAKENAEEGKPDQLAAAAAGSLTGGEIGVTKAEHELGNKEAAAGTGMAKVASCIEEDFVICSTHPAAAGSDMKEVVPQAFIESIKAHPVRRPPATLPERFRDNQLILSCNARINTMIDLYEDCVRQYEQKGYAEVGVVFTDAGKRIFRLGSDTSGAGAAAGSSNC